MLPARVLEDGIVIAVLTDTDPTDNTPISDILLAGAAKAFSLADPSSPHPSDNLPLHVVPHADVTACADDDGPGTPVLMLTYLPAIITTQDMVQTSCAACAALLLYVGASCRLLRHRSIPLARLESLDRS